MNTTWPHKKLEEVLVLNRSGFWGDDAASATRPIPVKVIRNADITKHNSIKGSASRYFSAKEVTNAELQIGDIAMSSSGDVGKAWLVNEAGYSASNFIRILRPDSEMVLPSFLKYVLESAEGQSALASSTAGTTIQNLQKTFYSTLAIPLPPLPEQQRIVRLLDEAFEGIAIAKANAEKNLQNSRALFNSHLQAIFTQAGSDWARRKLNDLVEVQNGYAFSSKEYSDSGHFLMRIGNVQNGLITTSDPKFVRIPANDPLQRFTLKSGDVLVSLTGNVGRVGVIKEEHLPAALNQRVARISLRKNSPALKGWVLHFLFSESFRNALNEFGHGTAQKNVSTTDLVNITIPVPDEPQQLVAIRMLDELRNSAQSLTATYLSKMEALDALENSLLRHAFHDRLKVA